MIENRLHLVRDTAIRKDASKVHAEHGPKNWPASAASPSNQFRTADHANIAAGLRAASRRPFDRPLNLLGPS